MDSESFQFDLPQSLQVKLCRHMSSHHRHHYSQYHAITIAALLNDLINMALFYQI